MQHCTWVYVDDNSIHHHVGLYHGPQTGHLLIYCDSNVMVVDFNVFESKVYTFFIEEELLEVRLERKGDQMFYTFEINKKADTFRNRLRKKLDQRDLRQLWIFIIGMVLVIGGATAYWMSRQKTIPYIPPGILLVEGTQTTGKVFVKGQGKEAIVEYSFVSGSQVFRSGPLSAANLLLETQLPLASGDEFEVYYLPENPLSNHIFWNHPTELQVERYLRRVVEQHRSFYPASDTVSVLCAARAAYEWKGIHALADMYFQKKEPFENAYHNQHSYEKMLSDPAYQNLLSVQCK